MSNSNVREAVPSAQPAVYVPPHRNGPAHSDTRYSKNQLLDLFRTRHEVDGPLADSLSELYVGGWEPTQSNGVPGGWSRRDEQAKDHVPGPEVCWDRDGSIGPVGLIEMNDEEKEVRLGLAPQLSSQLNCLASTSCL